MILQDYEPNSTLIVSRYCAYPALWEYISNDLGQPDTSISSPGLFLSQSSVHIFEPDLSMSVQALLQEGKGDLHIQVFHQYGVFAAFKETARILYEAEELRLLEKNPMAGVYTQAQVRACLVEYAVLGIHDIEIITKYINSHTPNTLVTENGLVIPNKHFFSDALLFQNLHEDQHLSDVAVSYLLHGASIHKLPPRMTKKQPGHVYYA